MKKYVAAAVLAFGMSNAVLADTIYVDLNGKRERFDIEDFSAVTVGQFKHAIYSRFGLPRGNNYYIDPSRHFQFPEQSMKSAGLTDRSILFLRCRAGHSCD